MDEYIRKFKKLLINISNDKKLLVKILVIVLILLIALALKINDINNKNVVIDSSENKETEMVEEIKICIDISGEVNNPGVYEVENNARLYQIIEKAGGLTDQADTNSINQAKYVEDGEKIIIPSKNNVSNNQSDKNGLININTADKEELKEIPGVGDAIADRIIEYRETTQFKSIEDIMCVSGIGNATFEKMKSKITV